MIAGVELLLYKEEGKYGIYAWRFLQAGRERHRDNEDDVLCREGKEKRQSARIIIIQIIMSIPITLLIILLALLLPSATPKIIQVPPISSEQSLALRLDQTASIDSAFSPFGKIPHIYRKEIQQVIQGKEVDFPPCGELPPETSFDGTAIKHISDPTANTNKWLVYDFKQVLYPRRLIDIALHNSKLYYVLGDGRIKVNGISPDYQSINDMATHKLTQSNVAKGNIVVLPNINSGVFINHNQAAFFSLSNDTFTAVPNFQTHREFEAAIPLGESYFAVAYGEQGLWIYSLSLQEGTLKKVYQLNRMNSNISALDIRDIAYDSTRRILFLVDYSSGLLSLQLSFSTGLSAKFTSSTKNIKQCTLIYYDKFADQLYLNGRELHKFRISGWPIIEEKILPRQEIAIKEITATSKIVALVGRDIFEILIADRKAAIYEDRLLDKLILTEEYFVSANQDTIMVGRFSITPPTLRCSTGSPALLGSHRLVLKMTAACNQQYFNKNGFQPGPLNPDDKCVYTVYQNLLIWQPAVINTKPFMVIGLSLAILGLGILIWWGFSFVTIRRMRNNLENYQNLEEERGSEREGKQEVEMSKDGKMQSEVAGQASTSEKFQKAAKEEHQEEALHDIQ